MGSVFTWRSASTCALCIVLGCTNLADLKRGLAGVRSLRSEIVSRFGEPRVYVNVANGTVLTLMFANSRFAALPPIVQADTALEVALFVRRHYNGYSNLKEIRIGFLSQVGIGPLMMSKSTVPYSFPTGDLDSLTIVDSLRL